MKKILFERWHCCDFSTKFPLTFKYLSYCGMSLLIPRTYHSGSNFRKKVRQQLSTSSLDWNRIPPSLFFNSKKRWKSDGARLGSTVDVRKHTSRSRLAAQQQVRRMRQHCSQLDTCFNKRKNLYQVALLLTFYKGDHGGLVIQ